MEKDEYYKDLNINELDDDTKRIFKLDYLSQNLKSNIEYINWSEEMKKIYGNNAKLFKCKKDKILFYASNNECKKYPIYKSKCPLCKKPICYFCNRYGEHSYDSGTCCIRNKLKCIIYQDSLRFINPIINEFGRSSYKESLIYFTIPLISLLVFIRYFLNAFYYDMSMKNTELKENGDLDLYGRYLNRKDNFYSITFSIMDILYSLLLIIPFFILNIYFILLIILISIPFKFSPLKVILGIFYCNLT